jgi:F-type H+-transporting ATPase subunit b
MPKASSFKKLVILLALLAVLAIVPAAMAQEATEAAPATEDHSEAAPAAEGEDHSETAPAAEGGEGEAAEAPAGSPLVPLGINQGFLLVQIINFLAIFLLLTFFLWRPLSNMLDSRTTEIQKGLEDASAAANARRNAEAEAEKIVAAARADAARVVDEARARGEEVAKSVEAGARTEADRIRAEGRTRSTEERDRQLADLRNQVAAISVALAERLIGQALDGKRQSTIVNEFFTKVPAEARSLQGQVEVISAMPLTPEEQSSVKQQLGTQTVSFTVDPSILGGLVVRSQERVIDGSIRSGLNDVATRMR